MANQGVGSLFNINVNNVDECKKICLNDNKCNAFTHRKEDNMCWFKYLENVDNLLENPKIDAYVLTTGNYSIHLWLYYYGPIKFTIVYKRFLRPKSMGPYNHYFQNFCSKSGAYRRLITYFVQLALIGLCIY